MKNPPGAGRLALLVSLLALVVATAGTSYAAIKVGTKQLKKNAVTSAKIKNDAVTGADVKESSLGTVPSAGSVNGVTITKVDYRTDDDAGTVLFSGSGLTVTAGCPAGGDVSLTATTSVDNASIYAYNVRDSNYADPVGADTEGGNSDTTSPPFDLLVGGDGNTGFVTFTYENPSGGVVTGQLAVDENGPVSECLVSGMIHAG